MTTQPAFPLALAAVTAAPGAGAAWTVALARAAAWLRARAGRRAARGAPLSEQDVQAALRGLNAHLLRDIGAPQELIARHVEEIEPRALLGSLEIRG